MKSLPQLGCDRVIIIFIKLIVFHQDFSIDIINISKMMNSNFNSMRQGSSMYSGNYGMGSNSYQRGNSMMNANG